MAPCALRGLLPAPPPPPLLERPAVRANERAGHREGSDCDSNRTQPDAQRRPSTGMGPWGASKRRRATDCRARAQVASGVDRHVNKTVQPPAIESHAQQGYLYGMFVVIPQEGGGVLGRCVAGRAQLGARAREATHGLRQGLPKSDSFFFTPSPARESSLLPSPGVRGGDIARDEPTAARAVHGTRPARDQLAAASFFACFFARAL